MITRDFTVVLSVDHGLVQLYRDNGGPGFAVHAYIGGLDNTPATAWQDVPLQPDFNFSAYHTITVVKTDNTFTFYLDGQLEVVRTIDIPNRQVGLVTQATQANFQSFSITDAASSWGSAANAADSTDGGGVETGTWAASLATSGSSGGDPGADIGWHSIWGSMGFCLLLHPSAESRR